MTQRRGGRPTAHVWLVRHGRAAAGWDDHIDPGLDEIGRRQAAAVAERLASLGPLDVVTSPLRRCRQTMEPLAARWGVEPTVERAVGEIPSPHGVAANARIGWLRAAMAGRWSDLGPEYMRFRDGVAAFLAGLPADTIVCSHYVAINAAIGVATGDDRLLIHRLDNASVTAFEISGGRLHLVEAGTEADTLIR